MKGAPAKIHSIDGTKVTHVVIAAPSTPAVTGENGAGIAERREEADELRDQDKRARRGLGKTEAIDHFRRGHPAVSLHRFLRHVGEQRVGAAETHHRKLGEKQPDADQDMLLVRRSAPRARPASTRQRRPTTDAMANCRQRCLPAGGETFSASPTAQLLGRRRATT